MFDRILVPLDGSSVSIGVLPYISYLAGGLNIPVVLMSAIDPEDLEIPREVTDLDVRGYAGSVPLVSFVGGERFRAAPDRPRPRGIPSVASGAGDNLLLQTVNDARLEVENWLRRFATRLGQQGVPAEVVVSTGERPAEEILRLAAEYSCDLIAMATHDRNLLGQAIKGSVTNEVVRSAPVPVLAVTPEKGPALSEQPVTLSRLLVPLDGSPFAEAVLPYVEHLAERLSLEVLLVRVLGSSVYPVPADAYNPVDPSMAELYAQAQAEATQYLEDVAARLENRGLKVRWYVLKGSPARRIADLAQATPNNMMALASHGRSGFARWVLGSVAEELLRATGDPVLVIPQALAEEAEDHRRGKR